MAEEKNNEDKNVNSLEYIRNFCNNCTKCELSKTRTNVVFGKGNKHAKIMFIGEAPGEKEDLQGIPFVGAAGRELDKLLRKINLTLDDVYIANILKCRPPQNRDPNPNEIELCTPYLIKQMIAIKPQVICTLGNYSTKFILSGCNPKKMTEIEGISTLHGKVKKIIFDKFEFKIIPIYHPAAMLYKPGLRTDFEKDFEKINEEITKDNIIVRENIVGKKIVEKIVDSEKNIKETKKITKENNKKSTEIKNKKNNQKKLFEF